MKVILEFELPEERQEYEIALKAEKYYSAVESSIRVIDFKLRHYDLLDSEKRMLRELKEHINEVIK